MMVSDTLRFRLLEAIKSAKAIEHKIIYVQIYGIDFNIVFTAANNFEQNHWYKATAFIVIDEEVDTSVSIDLGFVS